MPITVVIASYNQLSTLPLVLASMNCQSVVPDRVIIADDGSCDATAEWVDSTYGIYSFDLRYVTHEHRGYGLTVIENLASSFVEGGRVMFTNADVVHGPDSVRSHSEAGRKEIAGGLVREVSEPVSRFVKLDDVRDFGNIEKMFSGNRGKVSNVGYFGKEPSRNFYGIWGGNFSVDASMMREVGGFNEEYRGLYGGEEADLIQRMRKIGCKPAWAYSSICYHLAHKSRIYGSEALGNQKYRKEHMI